MFASATIHDANTTVTTPEIRNDSFITATRAVIYLEKATPSFS